MVSLKRVREDDIASISKIPKLEDLQCYFPLKIHDIVKEIASYLQDFCFCHLRVTCKAIHSALKDIHCPIQITMENFERATAIPGKHLIKLDKHDPDFRRYIKTKKLVSFNVKNLTVDYVGTYTGVHTCGYLLKAFPELESLRIIRSRGDIKLNIYENCTLSSLEIYGTEQLVLRLYKKIERVLLCSIEKDNKYEIIRVKLENQLIPNDVASTIRTFCRKSTLEYDGFGMWNTYSFGTFVPRRDFLA